MQLILITHPEVTIDPDQPIDEWQLTEEGLARAQSVAESELWDTVDAVYSSPEHKADRVAQIVSEYRGMEYATHEVLAEIDRSATGYLPYDEFMGVVRQFFAEPDRSVRGWETARDATSRIVGFVEKMAQQREDETVALIGHGAIFALLLAHVEGSEPSIEYDQPQLGCTAQIDWRNQAIIQQWKAY